MPLELTCWMISGVAGGIALLSYTLYRLHPGPNVQWLAGYAALVSGAVVMVLLLVAFVGWWFQSRPSVALGAGLIFSLLLSIKLIAHAIRREFRRLNSMV